MWRERQRLPVLSIGMVLVAALLAAIPLGLAGAASFSLQRLEGPTRYETAVAVSQDTFDPPIDTLFVATGQAFPDALCAGPLAGTMQAPILLVRRDEIPAAVRREIARLQPAQIIVMGGPAAVSEAVKAELGVLARSAAIRVAGADRYATAAAVARAGFRTGWLVFLATGRNFPDALSGAPLAGLYRAPILLANNDGVPASTMQALRGLAPIGLVLLGDSGVLPDRLITEILAAVPSIETVTRMAGPTRYETSAVIANYVGSSGDVVYVAVGDNFPDALAAGPAAVLDVAPLLLSRRDCMPLSTYQALQDLDPETVVLLGGADVLSWSAPTTRCGS